MKVKPLFIEPFLTTFSRQLVIFIAITGSISPVLTAKTLAESLYNDTLVSQNNSEIETDAQLEESELEKIIYVNPQTGIDNPETDGGQGVAYQTITFAIQKATPGTIIQLSPGNYTAEKFPLVVKPGITLRGNEDLKGKGIEIQGGGLYGNRAFPRRNVAMIVQGDAKVSGLTITNNNYGGTGIWIESGKPNILNNTLIGNKREGVFVTGSATPRIENNRFTQNDSSGVSMTKKSRGEIRNNIFENTGFGIAIAGNAMPIISNNKIYSNRNGIVLTDFAKPQILLNNIENNIIYGIAIIGQAKPDMQENTFNRNGKKDTFEIVPYFR